MRAERSRKRYKQYFDRFREEGTEEEADVAAMRQLCQEDLYFLATDIYKLSEAKYRGRKRWYEPIHGPMCDMFESDEDTLVVVFRGAMKTTTICNYLRRDQDGESYRLVGESLELPMMALSLAFIPVFLSLRVDVG